MIGGRQGAETRSSQAGLGEQSNPLLYLARRHPAEPEEHCCGVGRSIGIGAGKRDQPDSLLSGPIYELRFTNRMAGQPQNDMKSGPLSDNDGFGAEIVIDGADRARHVSFCR